MSQPTSGNEKEGRLTALSTLYLETGRRAAAIADRQFAVVLQLFAVHAAVLAGIVLHQQPLKETVQIPASVAIGLLDVLAIAYIRQKALSYVSSQDLNNVVEAELCESVGLKDEDINKRKKNKGILTSGYKGSWFFAMLVGGIGVVTIIAVLTA